MVSFTGTHDIRMLAGKTKVEQVKCFQTQIMTAALENCRHKWADLSGHYGLGIGITNLVDLLVKAMYLPRDKQTIEYLLRSEMTKAKFLF